MIIPSGVPINPNSVGTRATKDIPDQFETLIVSYPKCGRTWLRSIIGKYLEIKYGITEEISLNTEAATKASNILCTSFTHDGAAMLEKLSYLELYYPRDNYATKNVIMLGRDLKDTMVSAYFQATKRIKVFDGPISEFIKTDQYGIRKLLAFYDVWMKYKTYPKNYLYITYEDLHATPVETVTQVFNLMGEADVDVNALQQSLDFNDFENQKKRESENTSTTPITKAKDVNDQESYKARKGKVGGYTEYLTPEDEAFIEGWVKRFEFDFNNLKR